ncbi:hypothetical protein EYF80_012276 [Liparis tanakae]|uniref:Uncharacterized protein n=1 Tax=Liparis tanakae TaxID=230148 RepID=A0A4Z2IJM6_9TELE|nr:hypothetical protein EYF80_012276 [Liparis tanakae]
MASISLATAVLCEPSGTLPAIRWILRNSSEICARKPAEAAAYILWLKSGSSVNSQEIFAQNLSGAMMSVDLRGPTTRGSDPRFGRNVQPTAAGRHDKSGLVSGRQGPFRKPLILLQQGLRVCPAQSWFWFSCACLLSKQVSISVVLVWAAGDPAGF